MKFEQKFSSKKYAKRFVNALREGGAIVTLEPCSGGFLAKWVEKI
jgi:nicotinamide mononucleotide (NMN) deamidase PncC